MIAVFQFATISHNLCITMIITVAFALVKYTVCTLICGVTQINTFLQKQL